MRITQLARRDYEGADLNPELAIGSWRLWSLQSQALEALRDANGLFAPVAVGRGKTLIALLAGRVLNVKLSLVFTKARIVDQMRRDFVKAKDNFKTVPTRILSYATLSQSKSSTLLDEIAANYRPEDLLLVFDEAHALAAPKSARTRRVIRFLRENPGVRVACLSGTLLSKSVDDVAHLAEFALRENSPFPCGGIFRQLSRSHSQAWKECLDVDGRPSASDWDRLSALEDFGADPSLRGKARRRSFRQAVSNRLRSAPGVVCSSEEDLGVSLTLIHRTIETPESVAELAALVERTKEDPGGEILPDPISYWRKMRELACGFWYRWQWANDVIDFDWLDARAEWARYVRAELDRNAGPGYDSPALVARQIDAEPITRGIHRAWDEWKAQKDKPAPPTVPVWVSDFLIKDAASFAESLKAPAIIWYQSKAVEEALIALDRFPVYGAGAELPEAPAHLCAASWIAHGTGRNLQAWSLAVIIEPPSSGKAFEQLLGRLHRRGQTADDVVFYIYQHTESFRNAVETAKAGARFVAETGGERQRLLYANESH
jgi:hypothetical protein